MVKTNWLFCCRSDGSAATEPLTVAVVTKREGGLGLVYWSSEYPRWGDAGVPRMNSTFTDHFPLNPVTFEIYSQLLHSTTLLTLYILRCRLVFRSRSPLKEFFSHPYTHILRTIFALCIHNLIHFFHRFSGFRINMERPYYNMKCTASASASLWIRRTEGGHLQLTQFTGRCGMNVKKWLVGEGWISEGGTGEAVAGETLWN